MIFVFPTRIALKLKEPKAVRVSFLQGSNFQPMNVNFGIVDRLDRKVKGGKAARNEAISQRAITLIQETASTINTYKKGAH